MNGDQLYIMLATWTLEYLDFLEQLATSTSLPEGLAQPSTDVASLNKSVSELLIRDTQGKNGREDNPSTDSSQNPRPARHSDQKANRGLPSTPQPPQPTQSSSTSQTQPSISDHDLHQTPDDETSPTRDQDPYLRIFEYGPFSARESGGFRFI
ncbi:unnamed protein product [Sphagnum balticum]